MLYQRNMFPLALDLAQKSKMDGKQQSAIYKRFGDHLYQKGDYDNAMVQYIRAIDTTEPSQVIRKVRTPWILLGLQKAHRYYVVPRHATHTQPHLLPRAAP